MWASHSFISGPGGIIRLSRPTGRGVGNREKVRLAIVTGDTEDDGAVSASIRSVALT
jgi:hypothetical protein